MSSIISPAIAAPLEAVLSLIACFFFSGAAKSLSLVAAQEMFPFLGARAEGALAGAAQVGGAALALIVLYAARFRPQAPNFAVALFSVAYAFARSLCLPACSRRRPQSLSTISSTRSVVVSWASVALILSQGLFFSLIVACTRHPGSPLTLAGAARCMSQKTLVWAPLFEEVTFRGAIFSVALHRAGGGVFGARVAAFSSVASFVAVHVPLFWAAGAVPTYVLMQVVSAAVAGAAWSAIFARNGSLFEVVCLHVWNNCMGAVWAALTSANDRCTFGAPHGTLVTAALFFPLWTAASLIGFFVWRSVAEAGDDAVNAAHGVVFAEEEAIERKEK